MPPKVPVILPYLRRKAENLIPATVLENFSALSSTMSQHCPCVFSNSQNHLGKLDLTAPHVTEEERMGRKV